MTKDEVVVTWGSLLRHEGDTIARRQMILLRDDMNAMQAKLAEIRRMLEAWRYETRECPACRQHVHTVDCVLVKLMQVVS